MVCRVSLGNYIIASNIRKELTCDLMPWKSVGCEWMGRRHDSKDQTNINNNMTYKEKWMSETLCYYVAKISPLTEKTALWPLFTWVSVENCRIKPAVRPGR